MRQGPPAYTRTMQALAGLTGWRSSEEPSTQCRWSCPCVHVDNGLSESLW